MAEPRGSVYIFAGKEDLSRARSLYPQLASAGFARARSPDSADAVVVIAGREGVEGIARLPRLEKRARETDFRLVVVSFGVDFAPELPLPGFLEARPQVDVLEPGGLERLVALLSGAEPGPEPPPELRLSPSVAEARRRAVERHGEVVTALQFAAQIAEIHPEYAGGLAKELRTPDYLAPAAAPDSWLQDVRELVSLTAAPALHGRVVMLGLGLFDSVLRRQYQELGFEEALVDELHEPLDELLTTRGLALWEEREPPPPEEPRPAGPEETVPTHTDNPATVDELGREGLARVLARRTRDMREQETAAAEAAGDTEHPRGRSFLVHLHAPWGMGKTSLLNFLRKELGHESGDPWIVVDFNAWRHQRIAPPWWWLMTALYHQGLKELRKIDERRARALVLREWWWRLRGGLVGLAMLALGAVGIVVVWQAGFFDALWGGDTDVSTLTSFLVAIAAIVTPLLTIWGAVRAASRWILTTSARGARAFIEHTRDPMETVQEHFGDLVRWLHYPVVVLVDDLDRCKGPYVVELLEGIQTLFRDQPVAYVVAADRDWLSDSYQAEYGDFVSASDEPGRPLGYLFLEKTFQMSVTLPAPSGSARDTFWGRLIRPGETVDRAELKRARKEADADFAGLKSEEEIRRKLVAKPGETAADQQARREAAAVQLATPAVAQEAEHALRAFAGLLDPNPRAMKRLVNAYGIARGIETLGGENLACDMDAQQQTALWTILSLRWPRLADHLAVNPKDVARIGGRGKVPEAIPEHLRPLFRDQKVLDVVRGAGVDAALDEQAVGRCAGQVQV